MNSFFTWGLSVNLTFSKHIGVTIRQAYKYYTSRQDRLLYVTLFIFSAGLQLVIQIYRPSGTCILSVLFLFFVMQEFKLQESS